MNRILIFGLILLLARVVPLASQPHMINRTTGTADGLTAYSSVRPGDTVWIQSGLRNSLRVNNFHGQPGNPIVFANLDGQLIIESANSYGMTFSDCSYFKLTGLPGKDFVYGIRIGPVMDTSGVGLTMENRSTDFEIQGCEIFNIGFAGIKAKTDPVCGDPSSFRGGFVQYNTVIHDCFIHDVGGEGLYIGHTSYSGYELSDCHTTVLPTVLVGTRIYNNRIERSGYDGIQVSSAVNDCEIHHNLLIDCSYRMVSNQMCGILIGGGTLASCYNNYIIDPYATGILVFGKSGTKVFNNLIIRPGKRYLPDDPEKPEYGIFLADKTNEEKTYIGIYNNTIIQPKADGIRLDQTLDFEVRIFNNVIADPGAFDLYENDNTARTGLDSYIYDTGNYQEYVSSNNFFTRSASLAGFANAAGDDYHLVVSSPLIDAGLNLRYAGVTKDLDDRERPETGSFDIGVFEYFASGSIENMALTSDFWISGLQSGSDHTIRIDLHAQQDMSVRVVMMDLAGRLINEYPCIRLHAGDQGISIPAGAGQMFILRIQSDKSVYARKIIIL